MRRFSILLAIGLTTMLAACFGEESRYTGEWTNTSMSDAVIDLSFTETAGRSVLVMKQSMGSQSATREIPIHVREDGLFLADGVMSGERFAWINDNGDLELGMATWTK